MDLLNTTARYIKSIPSLSPISIPFIDTIISVIEKGTMFISESVIMQIIEVSTFIIFIFLSNKDKVNRSTSFL